MSNMVKLGEICVELSDGLHAAPEFDPLGEYLFVNANNMVNGRIVDIGNGKRASKIEYEKYKIELDEQTLFYSIDGTIGNVAKYHGEKCILGKGACYLRLKPEISRDYIYYLLQSDSFKGYIQTMKTGSTIHHISLDTMRNFRFSLPNIEDQEKIVAAVSIIDSKISINMDICKELDDLAKTVYDYWFTQFDFPNTEGKPYRASGGEMVWNDQLKREIPKGWRVGCVGDLGSVVAGGTPSTSNENYYSDDDIAWITPNDLSGKEHLMFFSHGERDITQEGLNNSSAVMMPTGTVLFSSRAPIGYVAIAENEICSNQGFKSIVPTKRYGSHFIYYTIKRYTPAIAQQGVGTTFKEISGDTMTNFRLLLPPVELATQFENVLEATFEKRRILEHENLELVNLRDWLLPMVMNGQVAVE